MFRSVVAVSVIGLVGAAGRASLDLLGACTSGALEAWSVVDVRGDGSSAIQLPTYGACLGVPNLPGAYKLPVITDACDGAKTRLWNINASFGRIRDASTGNCLNAVGTTVNQSSCGGVIPYRVSRTDVASASTSTAAAGSAFDGSSEVPWVSAGGYGASGMPIAGSPSTAVSNATAVGQWVQISLAAPITIASYSIGFTSMSWPSSRRRPRGHALLGAQSTSGPWTTVGRVDDDSFVPLATIATFTSASMQSFSVYRLVVTRVHRMGDGSAEVGELVLVVDPQRFAVTDPTTSASAPVPWSVAALDPWAAPRSTIAQQMITTPLTGTVFDTTVAAVARYAAAIAAMDVITSAGTVTAFDPRSIMNAGTMTVPAGMPALGSGAWTLVFSMQLSASASFNATVSIARSSGQAALFVYDLSTNGTTISTAGVSTTQNFVGGHAYNILVVMDSGSSTTVSGIGAIVAGSYPAVLSRKNAITPTAFTPGEKYVNLNCH